MPANIKNTKQNMTIVDGYFYTFDEVTDLLIQKTDDGVTAFSYPLDTLLNNQILSLEHDGVNFWSLESTGTDKIAIKRWQIENYICKLKNEFSFVPTSQHKYSSSAFSIEHYHTTITGTYSQGATIVGILPEYEDKITSGMKVTFGPNENGESETVDVVDANNGLLVLADPLTYNYGYNNIIDGWDRVHFYKNIWFFNNYDGIDNTKGALYKLNAYTGNLITKYPSGAYKDITASTFYKVSSFVKYGPVDSLCFVKSTNILFINVNSTGTNLNYYGSMALDNISGSTISTIYDLAMYGQNIYRLQNVDGGFNYRLSTLTSMVASISLVAQPAIIAANQISTSNIIALVKDQFFQPVPGRIINFADDDTVGFVLPVTKSTDNEGKATITYTSGNTAREVKITATVSQS